MKPQSPGNSGETYSVADLPVRQAGLRGTCLAGQVRPSAFDGIILPGFRDHEIVPAKPVLSCSTYKFQCTAFLKFESHE
jgi:hypothetical protein